MFALEKHKHTMCIAIVVWGREKEYEGVESIYLSVHEPTSQPRALQPGTKYAFTLLHG